MDCAGLLCSWNSPGKNIGVGNHFLLQGILLIQRLNTGLLHCRQILYHLNHQRSRWQTSDCNLLSSKSFMVWNSSRWLQCGRINFEHMFEDKACLGMLVDDNQIEDERERSVSSEELLPMRLVHAFTHWFTGVTALLYYVLDLMLSSGKNNNNNKPSPLKIYSPFFLYFFPPKLDVLLP